jgi:elongation factor G
VGAPRVAYRHTLRRAIKVEGRHVKQTGGHGQFAVVELQFEPDPALDPTVQFEDRTIGGVVPRPYVQAVSRSLATLAARGGKLGWPYVGIRAFLVDGQTHDVDSSDLAFAAATARAFELATQDNAVLLEPVMHCTVQVPEVHLGEVIGDLGTRRAQVEEIVVRGDLRSITGLVPIAEMFNYASALRSRSQGRASFSLEPHGYDRVPESLVDHLIQERLRQRSR